MSLNCFIKMISRIIKISNKIIYKNEFIKFSFMLQLFTSDFGVFNIVIQ